jgi:hypothetical protein
MYKACPNCNKTYWLQHEFQDRCWNCLNINLNDLEYLQARAAAPSKARRSARTKLQNTKRHNKKSNYWQRPENRPADVEWPDGTKIWYLGPNRARTVGKHYKKERNDETNRSNPELLANLWPDNPT